MRAVMATVLDPEPDRLLLQCLGVRMKLLPWFNYLRVFVYPAVILKVFVNMMFFAPVKI